MREPRDINAVHQEEHFTPLIVLALWLNKHVGTPAVFIAVQVWTILWVGLNWLGVVHFDPLPACVIWLLISNWIQLSLMPLLLVAQNLTSKHDQLRAEEHYRNDVEMARDMNDVKAALVRIEAELS